MIRRASVHTNYIYKALIQTKLTIKFLKTASEDRTVMLHKWRHLLNVISLES